MYLYFSKKRYNRDKWSPALSWSGFCPSRFPSRFVPVGTVRDGRCSTPPATLPSVHGTSGSSPSPWQAGVFHVRWQTACSCPATVKRAATPWHLLDRSTPWLAWWQELILNWVSSWETVGCLTVVSAADPNEFAAWDLPSDLELTKLELEELLAAPESR